MHLITVYFRCGSIIVDFMLKFNKSVVVSEVMTTLQEAAKGGTFGFNLQRPPKVQYSVVL